MAGKTGEYLPITGTWSNGNVINIEIGMTFHFWEGANQCSGYTSIYYGPVLLAADTKYGSPNAKINIDDLANAKIYRKDNMLLTVDATDANGKAITLISFADVGNKGSSYRSWLRTEGEIEQLEYQKNGTPVWCSNLIPVGDVIVPDTPVGPSATDPATDPSAADPTSPTDGSNKPNDNGNGWILPTALGGATACAAIAAGIVLTKKHKKKEE
jgi:hypothetical protein